MPAKFITAITLADNHTVWVGTEDDGVFRVDGGTGGVQQFTTKDGLGDNCAYAVAIDQLGRVWVGHQSHGVSVYNGQRWQNYEVVGGLSRPDTLAGPLGERVFDIAVNPKNGDVWIATNQGLSRYSTTTGLWSYVTRLDGLPSDQIVALAFESDGTLVAGSQCDGLAIAKGPAYQRWQVITAPASLPLTSTGRGLVSNLINDILITTNDSIWVATSSGLSVSRDHGRSWLYVHGADWVDKVRGRYDGAPKGWEPPSSSTLAEDYVVALAQDAVGNVWVTHRRQPYEVLEGSTGRLLHQGDQKKQIGKALVDRDHFITALLPREDGSAWLGHYGYGLAVSSTSTSLPGGPSAVPSNSGKISSASGELAPMPLPAAALLEDELTALGRRIEKTGAKLKAGDGVFVGEDWSTKGDWVGRYGRQYGILCAADSPLDHHVAFGIGYRVKGLIGPHANMGDGLRHWVHWLTSENPNVLWDPCVGHRRQAEWDDHGEAYPMSMDGPDLWAIAEVPAGVHQVALYFFNKDGHDGNNRMRDYVVELKRWASDYDTVVRSAPLAHTRVHDFWGGHYKVFVIHGPGKFLFNIRRNYSFNTILSAVLIDRLTGVHEGVNARLYAMAMPWMGNLPYDPPERPQESQMPEGLDLLGDQDRTSTKTVWRAGLFQMQRVHDLLAYRAGESLGADEVLLARWRWKLRLWTPGEREVFMQMMKDAWEGMKKMNPGLESAVE